MKLKLSAALCAVLVFAPCASAAAATFPGDPNSESDQVVADILHTAKQAGWVPPFTPSPAVDGVEYAGRSDEQALELAVREHPQLFATQPTKVLTPPDGAVIETYLDDFSARIDVPGRASDVIAQ